MKAKKLAIKGHPTRGKEVIELLEMLGGINDERHIGTNSWKDEYYFLDNGYIRAYDWCDGIKFTLEGFWEKYPYKVGDKVVYEDDNDIVVISEMMWDDTVGDIFYNVKRINEDDCFFCPPELLKPYKETNMSKNKCKTCVYAVNNHHCGLRGYTSRFNRNYCSAQNTDKLPNGFELQDDGYFSWVNKEPKYPKTYKECCDVLGIDTQFCMKYLPHGTFSYRDSLIYNLQELLICRDAYWKIAGEEMGLDKPWEPNWTTFEGMPAIFRFRYNIVCDSIKDYHCLLVFPTEEMRDAFYENFKELIESCKELL